MPKYQTFKMPPGPPRVPRYAFGYLEGWDGEPILRSAITEIAYAVFDQATDEQITSGTAVVNASVFDTLQDETDDPRFEGVDPVGFNFRHTLPAACFPLSNKLYKVEYTFTDTSDDGAGDPLVVDFLFPTVQRLTGE